MTTHSIIPILQHHSIKNTTDSTFVNMSRIKLIGSRVHYPGSTVNPRPCCSLQFDNLSLQPFTHLNTLLLLFPQLVIFLLNLILT